MISLGCDYNLGLPPRNRRRSSPSPGTTPVAIVTIRNAVNTQIGLREFRCHGIVTGSAVGGGATARTPAPLYFVRPVMCCWR